MNRDIDHEEIAESGFASGRMLAVSDGRRAGFLGSLVSSIIINEISSLDGDDDKSAFQFLAPLRNDLAPLRNDFANLLKRPVPTFCRSTVVSRRTREEPARKTLTLRRSPYCLHLAASPISSMRETRAPTYCTKEH